MTRNLSFSKNKSKVLSNDINHGVYFCVRRKLSTSKGFYLPLEGFLPTRGITILLPKFCDVVGLKQQTVTNTQTSGLN